MSKSGSSSRGISDNGYIDSDLPKPYPPIPRNRFQKSGNQAVYEVKETKNACVLRIDVPGSPASSLVFSVKTDNVHFVAEEPGMPKYKHEGRKYEGTLVFDPLSYDLKKANAELTDGVLWITVPKVSVVDGKMNLVEKMKNVDITKDDVV